MKARRVIVSISNPAGAAMPKKKKKTVRKSAKRRTTAAAPKRRKKRSNPSSVHASAPKRHKKRRNPGDFTSGKKRRIKRRRNPSGGGGKGFDVKTHVVAPLAAVATGAALTIVNAVANRTNNKGVLAALAAVGLIGGAFVAKKEPAIGGAIAAGGAGFVGIPLVAQAVTKMFQPKIGDYREMGDYRQLSGFLGSPADALGDYRQLGAVMADDMGAVMADDMGAVMADDMGGVFSNTNPFDAATPFTG